MRIVDFGLRNRGDRSVVSFRAVAGLDSRQTVSRWENTLLPNEPNSSQRNGVQDVNGDFAKYGVVFWSFGVLEFRSSGVQEFRSLGV